jgi:nucleotide-binding universal stress UspA family protein
MLEEAVTRRRRRASRASMPSSPTPSIVCGVDESRASREALQVAQRLGERLGLRLVLAHVLPLPLAVAYPEIGYASDPYDLESDLRAGHGLLETAARNAHLHKKVAHKVAFGEPSAALVTVAEEENAELIVVGSPRRSAWAAALHGSISAALATRATWPVLVVPVGAAKTDE